MFIQIYLELVSELKSNNGSLIKILKKQQILAIETKLF